MTRLPPTSAVPNPASIFIPPVSPQETASSAMPTTADPAPTPLPIGNGPPAQENQTDDGQHNHNGSEEQEIQFAVPKLRLNVLDLNHPGASRFLTAINAADVFRKSVQSVLKLLYTSPSSGLVPPATRSVTLYLEDMDGVAYTKGSDLDNDHKEIHFSLRYINSVKQAPDGAKGDVTGAYEIHGVLVHELVHCYQYNGHGHCPGGLIEGIADWVRLRANLGAPHWSRDSVPNKWDAGYEKTAYFLEFLEAKFGEGTVRRINAELRKKQYRESEFWKNLFGAGIDDLWSEYLAKFKKN